jgi:hypothetical protein
VNIGSVLTPLVLNMDIIKDGPRTGKWPPIHSYANCSVAHGNIQERFASAVCGQDT